MFFSSSCSTPAGPELDLGHTTHENQGSTPQTPDALPEPAEPSPIEPAPIEPAPDANLCRNVKNGGACGPRGRCWEGRCVPMYCGDGTQDPHEQCDDGNRRSDDGCSMHCTLEYCGDGVLQPGREACEPALEAPGVCNAACILVQDCGNGRLDPAEQCDDANTQAQDGCSPLCTFEPRCGDGKKEPPEECDDGNLVNADGCSASCVKERCGDGIIQGQEQCDDGNRDPSDGCNNRCELPLQDCGNGVLDPGEVCDDGNFANDDACPNDCQLPQCGDGQREGLEGCDDGNQLSGDGCNQDCQPEYNCGNQVIERGEQCDDGNQNNRDDCPNDCQFARCGDGLVEGRETCDANTLPTSNCDAQCRWIEVCGDGRVTASEACDDGNTQDGDGCSSDCAFESCGNGTVEAPEQCDDGNAQADDGCTGCKHDWVSAKCSTCVVQHCQLPAAGGGQNGSRCFLADEACKATLDCYFETGCVLSPQALVPPDGAMGSLACFCGDTPRSACMDELILPDPKGRCAERLYEAFSTRVPASVVRDFLQPDFAAGRANRFANCMARFCHEDCFVNAPRPSCDPAACDDGNPCTRSYCNAQERCVHEPLEDGARCEAGFCAQGKCVQCLQDRDCGEASTCVLAPSCQAHRCVPGLARECEQDENPCTEASCDPDRGCVSASVNEGNPCADDRLCVQGACTATGNQSTRVVIPVSLQGSEFHRTTGLPSWYSSTYAVQRSFYANIEKLDRVAFHCFPLDSVQGLVVGASLRIVQPSGSYQSQHPQELVTYRDLGPGQSCEALANPSTSPRLQFNLKRQLKNRAFKTYGQLEVDASINATGVEPTVSVIELSAAAVEDINRYRAEGQDFPVGVFLEFQGKPSVDDELKKVESVFTGATGDEINELVLEVQPL